MSPDPFDVVPLMWSAVRAVDLLRKASLARFQETGQLKQDPDLDPRRDRAEFQKTIDDPEQKLCAKQAPK